MTVVTDSSRLVHSEEELCGKREVSGVRDRTNVAEDSRGTGKETQEGSPLPGRVYEITGTATGSTSADCLPARGIELEPMNRDLAQALQNAAGVPIACLRIRWTMRTLNHEPQVHQ